MRISFLALAGALFLSGCVNLHVHFPEAPPDAARSVPDKSAR